MREDRRKARRFPVTGDHQKATLRVGDALLGARLTDQSSTGFGICIDQHPGVFPGEIVWLQTIAGWAEVRVVKARHDVDGTHIGLERIADLATGPQVQGRIFPEQLVHEPPHRNPWPILALVLGLSALVAFLGWTAFKQYLHDPLAIILPQNPSAHPDPRPAAVRAIEHEATRRASDLHKSIQQFGAAMLTLPEVVEQLQLNASQRQCLQKIVSDANLEEQSLRQAALANGDRTIDSKIQQLRHDASEAALQVLEAGQRQQWKEMFDAALERLRKG